MDTETDRTHEPAPVSEHTQGRTREPAPVSEHTPGRYQPPLVSICCITFNHENFIDQAIRGFLAQKTSFPVEILIHDDASTDKTAEIIRGYVSEYPGLIRPVYQTVNQYSQGGHPEFTLIERSQGTYIAFCEGDDYWTDPLKLQKQADFLEQHPDYAACFGGYSRKNEITAELTESLAEATGTAHESGFTFGLQEMTGGWLTKTLTALVRKEAIELNEFAIYRHYRDIHLFYHVIRNSKAFYLRQNVGVYRIHPAGVNSMQQGKVNANAAYECYRELYQQNRDGFTRQMYFKSTAGLLNYNLYNTYPGNTLKKNTGLLAELLRHFRGFSEFRIILFTLLRRELKDSLKIYMR